MFFDFFKRRFMTTNSNLEDIMKRNSCFRRINPYYVIGIACVVGFSLLMLFIAVLSYSIRNTIMSDLVLIDWHYLDNVENSLYTDQIIDWVPFFRQIAVEKIIDYFFFLIAIYLVVSAFYMLYNVKYYGSIISFSYYHFTDKILHCVKIPHPFRKPEIQNDINLRGMVLFSCASIITITFLIFGGYLYLFFAYVDTNAPDYRGPFKQYAIILFGILLIDILICGKFSRKHFDSYGKCFIPTIIIAAYLIIIIGNKETGKMNLSLIISVVIASGLAIFINYMGKKVFSIQRPNPEIDIRLIVCAIPVIIYILNRYTDITSYILKTVLLIRNDFELPVLIRATTRGKGNDFIWMKQLIDNVRAQYPLYNDELYKYTISISSFLNDYFDECALFMGLYMTLTREISYSFQKSRNHNNLE